MPLPACKDCNAPALQDCDCIEYTGEVELVRPEPDSLQRKLNDANMRNVALMADLTDARREIAELKFKLEQGNRNDQ